VSLPRFGRIRRCPFRHLIAYAIMSAGVFGVIILVSNGDREADQLDDYMGLARRNPWHAFLMLMMMFSLAGIPVFLAAC